MKALNIPNEIVKTAPVKVEVIKEIFGDMEMLTKASAQGGVNKPEKIKKAKKEIIKDEVIEVVKKPKTVKKAVVKVKEVKVKKVAKVSKVK